MIRRKNRWFRGLAVLFIVSIVLSGCSLYRLQDPHRFPGSAQHEHRVVWSFLWGAVVQPVQIDSCNGQPVEEVQVRSNLGYSLITVLSLGLASPVRLEWKCAAPSDVTPGDLGAPGDSTGAGGGEHAPH
jgi:hypothetical protein